MAASTENVTLSPLFDTIDVLNQTNGTNTTQKEAFVASTEGMLLSYSFLLLAALLCVYFGSYRSVIRKDKQKNLVKNLMYSQQKMRLCFHLLPVDFYLEFILLYYLFPKNI
jgi:hypothetical protein